MDVPFHNGIIIDIESNCKYYDYIRKYSISNKNIMPKHLAVVI